MEIQWPLVLFTALVGTGGYLFACVGLNEFIGKNKPAVIYASAIAIVLLGLGGISSATHLTHVERMLNALNRPTSGIFLEAMMIFILIALAFVFIILVYRDSNAIVRKIIGAAGICVAFGFSYSGGESYVMSSQAMWDTPLFVAACLGAPLAAGISLWKLLLCLCRREFRLSDVSALLARLKRRKKAKRAADVRASAPDADAETQGADGPGGQGDDATSAMVAADAGQEDVGTRGDAPAPAKLPALPGSALEFKVTCILLIVATVYAMTAQIVYGTVMGPAFGEYALFFWLVIILCGGIVPFACALIVLVRKPERVLPFATLAFLGGITGAVSFRAFQWLVGGTLMNLFGVIIQRLGCFMRIGSLFSSAYYD